MFDVPTRDMFHNELVNNPEFGFQKQKCQKTKGRNKRHPVVKDLNDGSVFDSGKLTR